MRKLFIAAVLATVAALPAEAQHCSGTWQPYACVGVHSGYVKTCYRCVYPRTYYRERYGRRAEIHRYRDHDDERWERRDPASERGASCKDTTVRVVGGAHLTKDGAINDAVRQWQSTVRYDFGERFMDVENARGYRWRCDRASTNESAIGRVGEAVTGGGAFQKRCVVMATPCMQPVQRGDKDER